ncbi:putative ubiquitin carboxyl-terminal hydrolase [Gregarina niphandrodes]|uniref:Ubiquitin carboxyl-terminal hydrolase n=1 Tax=Gregarina niphandrodes TaxID=110365 RepID=A0A023B046_GRENI|nr:putative ubiquitin carboxyl-terminal hydrolase [Gregarina niphandrodes]EZG44349.1 putative ubiquitin carboxyl-terminal hydrolase [Gregarina niphandrodes]|eukprot:XP_011132696.1 putative ubiquitin carboxyl-terminal hydrolase [Gregarina niphandrodes]
MIPLEANPPVFRSYLERIDPNTKLDFEDVYILEPLPGAPQPLALICLFSLNDQIMKRYQTLPPAVAERKPAQKGSRTERESENSGQAVKDTQEQDRPVWFTRQFEKNACGPVAIMHAVMNIARPDLIDCDKLAEFAGNFQSGSQAANCDLAHAGQTKPPVNLDDVSEHFVAFIPNDGHLYELDGRMNGPIDHGPCDDDNWTQAAFETIQNTIVNMDPNNYRFVVMALTHH